jgi:hypothetical protein
VKDNISVDIGKLEQLVALANANRALMDGSLAPVLQLMRSHDVAVCIWQDRTNQNGVGLRIIKGTDLVRRSFAGDQAPYKLTVIPCENLEQAMALSALHGDGAEPSTAH